MNKNIALLSKNERDFIELDKKAALLIHKKRKGKLSKSAIRGELEKMDESENKEFFRESLNKYSQN